MRLTSVLLAAVVSCLMLILVACASASVPPMINYQGKLMQPSGVPVPDGTFSMTFAMYSVPTGGTALWSEANPSVQVKGGLFSVLLGSVNNLPANIFDNENRWFGVTVGTDPEMTPRQQIASVGYAVKAGSADIAATVPDGTITTSKLKDGSVTAGKIAPRAVGESEIADGAVTAEKIADGGVGISKVSPGTIALNNGYAKRTADFYVDTAVSDWVQVPDLTVTVNLPGNGRLVRISAWCSTIQNYTGGYVLLSIWEGPVNTGTPLARTCANTGAHGEFPASVIAILPVSSGTKTFNVGLRRVGGGDAILAASPDSPAFILVEAL